jgi:hypothetical protein
MDTVEISRSEPAAVEEVRFETVSTAELAECTCPGLYGDNLELLTPGGGADGHTRSTEATDADAGAKSERCALHG